MQSIELSLQEKIGEKKALSKTRTCFGSRLFRKGESTSTLPSSICHSLRYIRKEPANNKSYSLLQTSRNKLAGKLN